VIPNLPESGGKTMTSFIRFSNRLPCIVASWLLAGVLPAAQFAGGTGEPNDPYQIATAEQLLSIGSDPNLLDKHFVLLNDLDLDPNLPGGQVFTQAVIPPAVSGQEGSWSEIPFAGSFDGRGHKVCHLMIRADGAGHRGLFGYIGKQGTVRDLGIVDADVHGGGPLAQLNEGCIRRCYARSRVSGGWGVGGLVGANEGEIIDCWAEGEVIGDASVGGLVGQNGTNGIILNSRASSQVSCPYTGSHREIGGLVGTNYGTIVHCHATGDVSGLIPEQMGGLVGAGGGIILNCHAAGNVSATRGRELGGLVGHNPTFIAHSYATGNVSGGTSAHGTRDGKPVSSSALGGLVGSNGQGYIYACYASGDVSGGDGSSYLGGLVGSQSRWGDVVDSYCVGRVQAGANSTAVGGLAGSGGSGINASFWDIEASGWAESAGGTGLTTAQMQDAATFLAAGWDWVGERANGLVDPWFIPESGGYPRLTFGSDAFRPYQLDGSGTADNPYRIATAEDLAAINHCDLTACYRLEADVNLAPIIWKESPVPYFNGQLDGAGRTVFHLRVQSLFGLLDRNASVVNLGIRAANVAGTGGMLAGKNKGCIAACCADGTVSGISGLGGLTGSNDGSISDSYVVGDVNAVASYCVGGLTGLNFGSISRCYAAARVTGTEPVPGYVDVTGGLVGDNYFYNRHSPFYPPGQVYESYFLIDVDGGGPDNGVGIPLADAQMRLPGSFAGWDFETVWTICEGQGYPRLRWEQVPCGPAQ
jgi:hypothetical protein